MYDKDKLQFSEMKEVTVTANPLETIDSVTVRATETMDEFIFEVISEWYMFKTQRKISKEELLEALTKRKPVKPLWPEEVAFCGACTKGIVGWDDPVDGECRDNYCRLCGQKVDWDDKRTTEHT